jgi:hypothetical protein
VFEKGFDRLIDRRADDLLYARLLSDDRRHKSRIANFRKPHKDKAVSKFILEKKTHLLSKPRFTSTADAG